MVLAHCLEDYRDSVLEYWRLLRSPKLTPSMFDLNAAHPEKIFQEWSVLRCVARMFALESSLLLMSLSCLMRNDGNEALLALEAALAFFIVVFVESHLPWHCIIKRHGFCGSSGYLLWSAYYLILFSAMLHHLYNGLMSARKVDLLWGRGACMTLGISIYGLSDFFLFLACAFASEKVARAREGRKPLQSPFLEC